MPDFKMAPLQGRDVDRVWERMACDSTLRRHIYAIEIQKFDESVIRLRLGKGVGGIFLSGDPYSLRYLLCRKPVATLTDR